MATIRTETKAWERNRINKKAKIYWQFKTDDARIKLKRLYPIKSLSLRKELFCFDGMIILAGLQFQYCQHKKINP